MTLLGLEWEMVVVGRYGGVTTRQDQTRQDETLKLKSS